MALRSMLLKITGDPADARKALADTAADLKKLDGSKAEASVVLRNEAELRKQIDALKGRLTDLGNEKVTPEVDLQTTVARAELARLEGKLSDLDGQTVEAKVTLRDEAVRAQIAIVQARFDRLSRQDASPKVTIQMARALEQIDRLEGKLSDVDRRDVSVDINVDRRGALSGITGTLGAATGGFQAFASAATAGIPAVSRLIQLGVKIGPAIAAGLLVVLPLLGALISSFAAAAAGAVALGVAFAGAFGPVALVVVAAVSKLVEAFKVVDKQSEGAVGAAQRQASAADSIASAQDGVRTSTEGLASAQGNLRQATTDAYRAWQDSIEAVKDDLLSVERAQLGIDESNLRLREAQQELRDFRAEAGLAGDAFGAIFEKFTDVAIDTSGLQSALSKAVSDSGGSEGDQLRLERLILNVRDAKLAEKEATDSLSDANTQLKRDRMTEAEFAERGIAAFEPYRQALQGVVQAQRSLIASRRQLAQAQRLPVFQAAEAPKAPTGPVADLVATIKNVKKTIDDAFGPALDAVFRGANRGLKEFTAGFKDPGIQKSLTAIGEAIGSVFVTLGRLFASKEFREGFITLAKGGAQLVKVLGERVFVDFVRLMLRLAVAALPDLIDLLRSLARRFKTFVDGTRDAEQFRKKIEDLIDSTRLWGRRILDIIEFLARVARFLTRVQRLGSQAFGVLKDAAQLAFRVITGDLRLVGAAAEDAWDAVRSAFSGAASWAQRIGKGIGEGLVKGIRTGLRALESIGKFIANGLIGAVNFAIRAINQGLPNKVALKGLPDINLPDNPIPQIPRLGDGGLVVGRVLAELGERAGQHEAVFPLTQSVFQRFAVGITSQMRSGMVPPALAGAGARGMHVDNFNVKVDAPAGELPDARYTASALIRLMERTAGGSPRQD